MYCYFSSVDWFVQVSNGILYAHIVRHGLLFVATSSDDQCPLQTLDFLTRFDLLLQSYSYQLEQAKRCMNVEDVAGGLIWSKFAHWSLSKSHYHLLVGTAVLQNFKPSHIICCFCRRMTRAVNLGFPVEIVQFLEILFKQIYLFGSLIPASCLKGNCQHCTLLVTLHQSLINNYCGSYLLTSFVCHLSECTWFNINTNK